MSFNTFDENKDTTPRNLIEEARRLAREHFLQSKNEILHNRQVGKSANDISREFEELCVQNPSHREVLENEYDRFTDHYTQEDDKKYGPPNKN